MVFDVKEATRSYQVELSPLTGVSFVKEESNRKQPLQVGLTSFMPKEGFQVEEGLSSQYTLGMDFLADKTVAIDFRDGSFCIWQSSSQAEARKWVTSRLGNGSSAVEAIRGTPNEMGISLNCRTDRGPALAQISLGAYGSTLDDSLKSGHEVQLAGRPGLLSNFIQIEQRKVLWPWFLSTTKPRDEDSASPATSVVALSTLKSRVVCLDFARGEVLCEAASVDDQVSFTLQEALRVPFQIKGDDIYLGSRNSQENKYIDSFVGSKLLKLNDMDGKEVLSILRGANRAQIQEAANLLFGTRDSQLEIEKPDGEVLEITLTRN